MDKPQPYLIFFFSFFVGNIKHTSKTPIPIPISILNPTHACRCSHSPPPAIRSHFQTPPFSVGSTSTWTSHSSWVPPSFFIPRNTPKKPNYLYIKRSKKKFLDRPSHTHILFSFPNKNKKWKKKKKITQLSLFKETQGHTLQILAISGYLFFNIYIFAFEPSASSSNSRIQSFRVRVFFLAFIDLEINKTVTKSHVSCSMEQVRELLGFGF